VCGACLAAERSDDGGAAVQVCAVKCKCVQCSITLSLQKPVSADLLHKIFSLQLGLIGDQLSKRVEQPMSGNEVEWTRVSNVLDQEIQISAAQHSSSTTQKSGHTNRTNKIHNHQNHPPPIPLLLYLSNTSTTHTQNLLNHHHSLVAKTE
jgi:hypothetical protein